MRTKEELKKLIKHSQVGIIKEYNYSDLGMYALDERQKIKSGIDVFAEYIVTLPKMLADGKKVSIQSRENKLMGKKEMMASCFILSAPEVNEILNFIETCSCVRIENGSADQAKEYFKEKVNLDTGKDIFYDN